MIAPTLPAADLIIADALAQWEQLWAVPGLAQRVSVTFSRRLRVSLGRAIPATGRVVLQANLRDASPDRLREVLCHEVAHVAAAQQAAARGALRPRAHGPEWAALVAAAGYVPAMRAANPGGALPRLRMLPPMDAARRGWVVHTCPVCHMQRLARRRVAAWRCAACIANGLAGDLVVSRSDAYSGRQRG